MDNEDLPYHIPNKYIVGDQVLVVKDIKAAHAWYQPHSRYNTEVVGRKMFVGATDPLLGYCLSDKRRSGLIVYVPSCALELVPQPTEATIDVPTSDGTSVVSTGRRKRTQEEMSAEFLKQGLQSDGTPLPPATKKPRTKTKKEQPWDTAPCTHLRWHLMGLLKEKLKMKVSAVYDNGVLRSLPQGTTGMAMVTTCCVKCGTRMEMSVPVEGR